MNYVLGKITSLSLSNNKEVPLKARGRAITAAVDVTKISRQRFMKELTLGKITTGTEELSVEEGGTGMVSTTEITLPCS